MPRLGSVPRVLATETRNVLLRPRVLGRDDQQLGRRVQRAVLHRPGKHLARLVRETQQRGQVALKQYPLQ